jgi:3-dehydroquinate synthase
VRRLEVKASTGAGFYPVHIGAGALDKLPLFVAGKVLAVVDSRVPTLPELGEVPAVRLQAGEEAKTLAGLERVLDAFGSAELDRDSTVLAVGGGTVGDLAGFAASIWHRGIAVVQVPTTLLAMVDSAIGGKTGINSSRAKNAIGTFWPPRAVLADTRYLATLPADEEANGWAEIVKYAVTFDPSLSEAVDLEEVIERCVRIKGEIVAADERETAREGGRVLLNYGHTVGHALEAVTGFRISHGRAVAWGMRVAAAISAQLGEASPGLMERQDALLSVRGLPGPRPEVDLDAVLAATRRDKKVRGGRQTWVLLRDLGRPLTTREVPDEQVSAALAEILHG